MLWDYHVLRLQGQRKQTPSNNGALGAYSCKWKTMLKNIWVGNASNHMNTWKRLVMPSHQTCSPLCSVGTPRRAHTDAQWLSTVPNKKPKGVLLNSQLFSFFLGTVCVHVCVWDLNHNLHHSPHQYKDSNKKISLHTKLEHNIHICIHVHDRECSSWFWGLDPFVGFNIVRWSSSGHFWLQTLWRMIALPQKSSSVSHLAAFLIHMSSFSPSAQLSGEGSVDGAAWARSSAHA